ncbi:neuromedin U receptor [Branchiostoma belcheri]|nr:neuromedin U receptor [Branchiostoma belcheri]
MADFDDVAENRSLDALNASEGLPDFNHTFWMGDMGEMEPLSPVTLVLVSVWSGVIFLVGILGNLSVGLAVWGNRELRTPTNFFLLNLSVADLLLLLFCLPVYVVELWVHFPWLLGETMFKRFSQLTHPCVHTYTYSKDQCDILHGEERSLPRRSLADCGSKVESVPRRRDGKADRKSLEGKTSTSNRKASKFRFVLESSELDIPGAALISQYSQGRCGNHCKN